jgi:hypothetical protein
MPWTSLPTVTMRKVSYEGRGKDAGENVTLVLIFSFWVIH